MFGTLMTRKIFPLVLAFTTSQLAWADGDLQKYQQTPPETAPQPSQEQRQLPPPQQSQQLEPPQQSQPQAIQEKEQIPPPQQEKNNVQAQKTKEQRKKEVPTISSGFGLMRAYNGRKDLHASGGAEIKIAYPMGLSIGDSSISASFRYMPFNVAPSVNIRDVEQAYRGIIETFNLGAEADLSFDEMFDFVVSLEAGIVKSNFDKIIPVIENELPIKKAGTIFFFSSEARFKPLDTFYLGPKLSLGVGEFTSWNLFVNAIFIL